MTSQGVTLGFTPLKFLTIQVTFQIYWFETYTLSTTWDRKIVLASQYIMCMHICTRTHIIPTLSNNSASIFILLHPFFHASIGKMIFLKQLFLLLNSFLILATIPWSKSRTCFISLVNNYVPYSETKTKIRKINCYIKIWTH